jgi:hypothetical protein
MRNLTGVRVMQAHAVAALPNAMKPWRRDQQCPPPLGRDAYFPLTAFATPLEERWPSRFRSDSVVSCHLELTLAAVAPDAFVPQKVQIDEMSDDGDRFAIAVHAASLAQWTNGMRGVGSPHQPFAAFGVASALLHALAHWPQKCCNVAVARQCKPLRNGCTDDAIIPAPDLG